MKCLGKHKLGWHPDLPDFRDHGYELSAPITLPPRVDLRETGFLPPVYNQGDLGSCTGNAIAAAFDFERAKQGKSFITPSRLFIYYNERDMEGTVADDAGAAIRDGIKSVRRLGVCPESEWTYDINRFADKPTVECYADALNHQVLRYRRIGPSEHQMLNCLANGYPFVFGFSVYDSFEADEVERTGIVPMPQDTEQLLGGHAVLCVGYDLAKRIYLIRNSWSETWGEGGHCWMPFEYLTSPNYADDRWAIKLVE